MEPAAPGLSPNDWHALMFLQMRFLPSLVVDVFSFSLSYYSLIRNVFSGSSKRGWCCSIATLSPLTLEVESRHKWRPDYLSILFFVGPHQRFLTNQPAAQKCPAQLKAVDQRIRVNSQPLIRHLSVRVRRIDKHHSLMLRKSGRIKKKINSFFFNSLTNDHTLLIFRYFDICLV